MRSAVGLFFSFRPRARLEVAGLAALMLVLTATYVGQGPSTVPFGERLAAVPLSGLWASAR